MLPHFLASALLFFGLTFVTMAQIDVVSRFLPNKEYSITISQTLSGTDGYRDVVPSSNVQRFTVRTGAMTGDGFPVAFTVFSPTQSNIGSQEPRIEWDLTFKVTSSGELNDVAVISSLETMEDGLVRSILSRKLADIMIFQQYQLESGRNAGTPRMEQAVQRDGTGTLYDVTYVMQLPTLKEAGAPMTQQASGYGVFDAHLGFFTELVKKEVSKIFVEEDASGQENHVEIHRETRIVATIKDTGQ